MSEFLSDFFAFAPSTPGGDWAWVTLSWLLTAGAFAGYWLHLRARAARLDREGPPSTAR